MLLVTTGIPETRDTNKPELLLGKWCLDYGANEELGANSKVQPFHWYSRQKFVQDYHYIVDLNERILVVLRDKLNRHHQVSKSLRYWRILLGPWLNLMTPILWDRYESLRIAFADNDLTEIRNIMISDESLIPSDCDEFAQLFNDHFWNHKIYSKILFEYIRLPASFESHQLKITLPADKTDAKKNNDKLICCYRLLDKCLALLCSEPKIVAFNTYFDNKSLMKLLVKFNQFPRKYYEFSESVVKEGELSQARTENLGLKVKTVFEKIVDDLYMFLLPRSYLENYQNLAAASDKIKYQCKVIISAVSHNNNDLFKLWTAEKVENGCSLIIVEHGGGIPLGFSLAARHDDLIADKRVVWHKEYSHKHVNLSPTKLIVYPKMKRISKSDISLICWDIPLYTYKAQSGPYSSIVLQDYAQKKNMIDHLDAAAFRRLRIRTDPNDMGWRIKQRYIDDFGRDQISSHKTLKETLQHSKLVICTYPSTNFSESMESGIPTIMLYISEFWETRPEFDDLVNEMVANKLFFTESKAAAEHINEIAQAPDEWWNSTSVKKVRKSFHEYCGCTKPTWLKDWTEFLEQELAS
jgi:putative transferase (TIGR04331 family)